jgi:uncharacterized membrane protein
MGPLEFLIVGFEGNHFTGEIMPELDSLRARGLIRVIDLVFVKRDGQGRISSIEVTDLPDEVATIKEILDREPGEWFAKDDIEQIGESLQHNSAVAMVLIEHVWAEALQRAVSRANGQLMTDALVPRDVVAAAEELLKARA